MIEKKLRNIVVSGFGTQIKKSGDLLSIKFTDGEKHAHELISVKDVEQLILAGECSITHGAVRELIEEGVDIVFVSHWPNFFARVIRDDINPITKLWRIQLTLTPERRLALAKDIVDGSIYNRIRFLEDFSHDEFPRESLELLRSARKNIETCQDNESLMGVEGSAGRAYFNCFKTLLPSSFEFTSRIKNPPVDPINSLLSYGYVVLASRTEYALHLAGLNTFEGLLHGTYRNQKALVYDLIEEFRQIIVDRTVLTLIRRGSIKNEGFETDGKFCKIPEKAKRAYLDALYTRFENTHKYGEDNLEYLDILNSQAKVLAEAIRTGDKYRSFKYR